MIGFLRTFLRRRLKPFQRAVRIPGKFPWKIPTPSPVPYGTILFEDNARKHYADGMGGVVSIEKARRIPAQHKPRPPQPRRRRAF